MAPGARRQPTGPTLRAILGTGVVVVALCLGLATAYAVISMRNLADQSERLLTAGMQTTRLIEQLADRITELERTARQYAVVQSPNLRDIYRERRLALLDTLRALEGRGGAEELTPAIEALHAELERVEAAVDGSAGDSSAGAFAAMNALSGRVRDIAQNRIGAELRRLRDGVEEVERALIALGSALAVSVLLAALAFARFVRRPMRQITDSITTLGRAELNTPIHVSGPRDLQTIGTSLEWLRQRILTLEAEKATFLRHMSHELRSPLANIKTGLELLKEDPASELDKGEISAIVERNVTRLQKQIDNLLDYAGWQDAEPRQRPESIRLDGLLRMVIRDHEMEARTRRIDLRAHLLPVRAEGEHRQLRTLMDNLVGNAIQYSPNGGSIDVRLTRVGDEALIDVEDQGPGIPAELRERVFEPFFRGPDSATSAGTGIGLSVALAAARAHEGSIRILEKAQGAHVRVALPLR
ncbi:MAG: ATP-binding protein [Pseudomonadota bacterium]